jgi:hypothetical protein
VIKDPEVRQPPRTILQILFEWPSCRHDLIAFSGDIVDLKHQFCSGGRQPCRTGARNCLWAAPTRTWPRCIDT